MPAEVAQQRMQADLLRGFQRARRAARLEGQRMRPFAGKRAEHRQEGRARRHHLGRGAALQSLEARRGARMPRPRRIFGAGEIRHEEQVEVREVVGQVLHGVGEVAGDAPVGRRGEPHGVGQRARRRHRLRHRADAAHARREHQRIQRMLAAQDLLEAAIERRAGMRGGDDAVLDVEGDLEIALDAVEGSDDDSCHVQTPAKVAPSPAGGARAGFREACFAPPTPAGCAKPAVGRGAGLG